MKAPVIDICNTPLEFVAGIAYAHTFGDKLIRVFLNQTKRPSHMFGYMILSKPDKEGNRYIEKYCRACSLANVKKAVILN